MGAREAGGRGRIGRGTREGGKGRDGKGMGDRGGRGKPSVCSYPSIRRFAAAFAAS
jgi:hypothetical protein